MVLMALVSLFLSGSCFQLSAENASKRTKAFYAIQAKTLDGRSLTMADFKGKYLLIVNTASKCGYTKQYEGLEKLYKEYKDDGLVVLGFPCNQFGKQEPGTSEEIATFCRVNYGVSFPLFEKIDVNGENAHPLYRYLKGRKGKDIQWNFTKFLVSPKGKVLKRFESKVTPSEIDKILDDKYDLD